MNDKAEHSHCLICNCGQYEKVIGYDEHFLVRCINCNFVFSSKIPSDEELQKQYNDYGRDDYFSSITEKRYNELLDRFEKYRKTNKILDIGCGIGLFLEVAKKRGWEVYGTEYTEKAVEICKSKGIETYYGKLNPRHYDEKFDVITSFEVIEHIYNPQEEINNISLILRNGGAFYCTTPNFNSLSRNFAGSAWSMIAYPEHLSYYTKYTLSLLLKQSGFVKISIKTTGFSITRFKKSKKASNQPNISASSDDEKIRVAIEHNKLLQITKRFVNKALTITGKGDSLKGLFEKVI